VYELAQGTFRSPAGHPMTMAYRKDTNDWNTLHATLDQDEYKLPRDLAGTALDVGGYLGSVGIALALDNPAIAVTIVEPVPGNAELIRQNIELNEVGERVTLIEGAVSGDREPVTVWFGYRGNESAEHHAFVGNSTLAYDSGGALPHDEVVHVPHTLEDFGYVTFLKIDCEGGEWAFLDSPAAGHIETIVGEAHSVRGHRGDDIASLLAATHDVTIVGDPAGTCEFRAVRRG
jgi:FkbM family methyltransferase